MIIITFQISTSTFKLWSSLLERLSSTHRLGNNKSDSVINYTSTIQTMKEKIKMMEETEHTCNGLCHQRENHWELSTERYTLVTKMTKVQFVVVVVVVVVIIIIVFSILYN